VLYVRFLLLLLMGSRFSFYSFAFFLLLVGSYGVPIEVGKITKALWEADYKIMSLILDGGLCDIQPHRYCYIYDNQTVAVFAPPDEAFRLKNSIGTSFPSIVSSKVVLNEYFFSKA
jgi:hypothetical protein